MMYWMRYAELNLAGNMYKISDLAFELEVNFSDSDQLMPASITVFNLNPTHRNGIKKGDPVIINAGYEDDSGLIFSGLITNIKNIQENLDWKTEIEAQTAAKEWLSAEVYKSYQEGTDAQSIVQDLTTLYGIEVNKLELKQPKTYPRGRVCQGPARNVLKEIVEYDCKSRMLIRSGQLIISDPEQGVAMGYLLSPATGLLKTADDSDAMRTTTGQDTQKTPEQKNEQSAWKKRKCLLNYHLQPADVIQVESKSLNGTFLIKQGKHVGSRSGDWITEVEMMPV
jgi:hypothetical protein